MNEPDGPTIEEMQAIQEADADVGDGLCDRHARTGTHALRKAAQMPVARHVAVAMTDLERATVATAPSGKDHRTVAKGANRRA